MSYTPEQLRVDLTAAEDALWSVAAHIIEAGLPETTRDAVATHALFARNAIHRARSVLAGNGDPLDTDAAYRAGCGSPWGSGYKAAEGAPVDVVKLPPDGYKASHHEPYPPDVDLTSGPFFPRPEVDGAPIFEVGKVYQTVSHAARRDPHLLFRVEKRTARFVDLLQFDTGESFHVSIRSYSEHADSRGGEVEWVSVGPFVVNASNRPSDTPF